MVIPVRNESANIRALLEDLAEQPNSLPYDVIVVDDDSTDNTVQIVNDFQRTAPYSLRLLTLEKPSGFRGAHKKLALRQAIDAAQGAIIVTTDGDCRVGPNWLLTISRFFAQHQPVLLSSLVTFYYEKGIFDQLQTVEFASLIGSGAACLRAGYPTMCNGANLAFSRDAFYEVGGYEGTLHIPSGDDEFLLQKMSQFYPQRLAFLKQSEATVSTSTQKSLVSFYHQRKRWAGKWKLHQNYLVASLALFVFAYQLTVMITCTSALLGYYPWLALLVQLAPKVLLEYIFIRSVLRVMAKPLHLTYFLLMQLIYAPYAVFFGMRANFGGYTWKGRTYHG